METVTSAHRTWMSWEPRPRPPKPVDPMDDLVVFLRRESPDDTDLIDAYTAAKARRKAERANYAAWLNGEREPHPVVPEGHGETFIPGLKLALHIRAERLREHDGYREEWRP